MDYVGVEIDRISGEVRIRVSPSFAEDLLRDLDDLDEERVATIHSPLPNVASEVHRALRAALAAAKPKWCGHVRQPAEVGNACQECEEASEALRRALSE